MQFQNKNQIILFAGKNMNVVAKAREWGDLEAGGSNKFDCRPRPWRDNSIDLEVVFADTEELRQKAYGLRYQVYCLERNFEPKSKFPNHLESDEYDAQSLHAILVEQENSIVAGTVRLITPGMNGSKWSLPISKLSDTDAFKMASRNIQSNQMAEISRFAISKDARRALTEKTTSSGNVSDIGETTFQRTITTCISLKLMQAIVELAMVNNITHLYALMEPSLLRMLQRLAIYFEKMGPVVDCHGPRQPCFCDLDKLLTSTCLERTDVWRFLTEGVECFEALSHHHSGYTQGDTLSEEYDINTA